MTKISGVSTSPGQLSFGADFWGTCMLRIMNHSGLTFSTLVIQAEEYRVLIWSGVFALALFNGLCLLQAV